MGPDHSKKDTIAEMLSPFEERFAKKDELRKMMQKLAEERRKKFQEELEKLKRQHGESPN